MFLKRGAAQNDCDEEGMDPLSIAVQQANADIVTLYVNELLNFSSNASVQFLRKLRFCLSRLCFRLRLARMNDEMRESEGPFGQPGQYPISSPTEQQYKKCIQEFICIHIAEC